MCVAAVATASAAAAAAIQSIPNPKDKGGKETAGLHRVLYPGESLESPSSLVSMAVSNAGPAEKMAKPFRGMF